jgi:hypothetical protein
MTLNLTVKDGLVSVKPSLFQRKGFNKLAEAGQAPIELAAELPESIGREIAQKLFGLNTQGRPVILRLTTPSENDLSPGVIV